MPQKIELKKFGKKSKNATKKKKCLTTKTSKKSSKRFNPRIWRKQYIKLAWKFNRPIAKE